ncbi:MAG: YIP1 family protein [Anaerolineae bacterium]|nr:YIP1 family protein [Anaerolineae bacterium]
MAAISTLFRMIDRPGQAMADVAEHPRWWFVAAVLLIISMGVLLWVSAPYQIELANERSAEMIERVTANMSEEQAQAVRASARETTLTTYLAAGGGMGLATMALGWVLRAAIIHFSSAALGGTSAWGPTYAVSVWSMLPFFVRDIVQIVYVLLQKGVLQQAGLAFLVASGDWFKDSRSIVYNLLSNTDPFVLWHLLVVAVGIAVAIKVSRVKGAVLGLFMWVLFLGLKLIPVLVSSAVMGRFGP